MAKRMQYCDWCGKELGIYDAAPGEIESCGELECNRNQRDAYRKRKTAEREQAEEDQYDCYR